MSRKNKYTICISSPPDRNKLVAEIFFERIQWAEINQENSALEVQFYSRPDGQYWEIDYSIVIAALQEAKMKLLGEL